VIRRSLVFWQGTSVLSMVGLAVNPLIYAVGYDVFRKYLKQKLFKTQFALTTSTVGSTQQTRSVD